MFGLDKRLAKDTHFICALPLCDALLMNDARYPWVILVPRVDGITELYQLNKAEQQQLTKESMFVSQALSELVSADKMNVAALGNVVSQLHIHHVARFVGDQAWPAPVWGNGEAIEYTLDELKGVLSQLQSVFAEFTKSGDHTSF
jgi:diadenosine tetraphosphate (Ap4A) HIT family hydrolase